jgi:hypothetical protein
MQTQFTKDIMMNQPIRELFKILASTPINEDFCQTMAMAVHCLKARQDEFLPSEACGDESEYTLGKILNAHIMDNKDIKRRLGAGSFSTAYLGKDGFVYKMNINDTKYDSFLEYARLCLNTKNPLMPVVFELEVFDTDYCCKTEKLEKVELGFFYRYWKNLESLLRNEKIDKFVETVQRKNNVSEIVIREWVSKIMEIKKNTGSKIDLMPNNIMARGDFWVLNDPVAFGKPSVLTACAA